MATDKGGRDRYLRVMHDVRARPVDFVAAFAARDRLHADTPDAIQTDVWLVKASAGPVASVRLTRVSEVTFIGEALA